MAIGVEKLKDAGFSGLVVSSPPSDGTGAELTAPALFSLLAPAYCNKYGVDRDEMKEVLTRIAWKNHYNGARNPRAQFRREVAKETIACSPIMAGQLGIFDCSGVSDGSAAAVIVRTEDAHRYTDKPIYVKGLSFIAGPAQGAVSNDCSGRKHHEGHAEGGRDAFHQVTSSAGIRRARPRSFVWSRKV